MSTPSVRIPMLAILALMLSMSAGLAQPAPPETVVTEAFTPPEGQGDQGGWLVLTWDVVEGADGYRIWREARVDRVLDEAGHIVELGTPEDALVVWSVIDVVQPGEAVVRAVVAAGDDDMGRWAITTVQQTGAGRLESEPRFNSGSEGMALPAPPETVMAEPYSPEGQSEQSGVLLSWDAVEGADGYRIWREARVDRVLDEAGNLVELPTPKDALVVWSVIDAQPGAHIRAVVAARENGVTRWAVTTLQQTEAGHLESEPRYFHVPGEGAGTAVQALSWGDVKQQPRKDAR